MRLVFAVLIAGLVALALWQPREEPPESGVIRFTTTGGVRVLGQVVYHEATYGGPTPALVLRARPPRPFDRAYAWLGWD